MNDHQRREHQKREIHQLVEICLRNNATKSLPVLLDLFIREIGFGAERDEVTPVHFVIYKP